MRVAILTLILATSSFGADHVGPVTGIAATEKAVYSCSQAGILRCNKNSNTFSRIAAPEFRIIDLAVIDDEQLAICGGLPGASGMVGVLNISTGEFTTQTVSDEVIYALAFSRSAGMLAVACADGKVIRLALPLDTSAEPAVLHKHTAAARAVAFTPDGKLLVSGGLDGVLLMSRLGEDRSTRALQEHTAGIESLVFSRDGTHFASGARDSKVRLHSADGRLIRTYTGVGMENELPAERLPTRVWSVAWDDAGLVAGTSKGQLYRLSQSDDQWTLLKKIGESIYSLAVDSDGSLWIGSNGSLLRK